MRVPWGLIINQHAAEVDFDNICEQIGLNGDRQHDVTVHVGGPVETSRGFVLHSTDFMQESSLKIGDNFALTATVDMIQAIAEGTGPNHYLFALGYSGWGPGQLDREIQQNGWLLAPALPAIVFDDNVDSKWQQSLNCLGIDPAALSGTAGHA